MGGPGTRSRWTAALVVSVGERKEPEDVLKLGESGVRVQFM